jgi:ATP-binding cassette subfamily B protein
VIVWTDATAARSALADHLGGFEARAVTTDYDGVERLLRVAAPAVVEVEDGAIVVVGCSARAVRLLVPDGTFVRRPLAEIATVVRAATEREHAPAIERVLATAQVTGRAYERARRALIARQVTTTPVARAWLADVSPATPLRAAFRAHGLWLVAAAAIAASAVAAILWLACWWVAGRIALDGEASTGWIAGWVLLLATLIPVRIAASVAAGRFVVGAGVRLKQRMVDGSLRSSPDDIRRQGVGELMGRILEGETLETAGLTGALESVAGFFELCAACWVLAAGAHTTTLILLVGWTIGILWVLARWERQRRGWVDRRRELTLDTVDQMLGYRTRVVQDQPARWHVDEDAAIARYVEASRKMDDGISIHNGVAWRGWLLLGIGSLAPALITERADASLAVGLGGVLLAGQAIARMVIGLGQLIDARLAWQQIAGLLAAASTEPPRGVATAAPAKALEVHGISLVHRGTSEPILRGVDLSAREGDRILVQGNSGSGKSTLAMVIAGLRAPRSGTIFLGDLDRSTLGSEAWSRRVILVPQFHDNHVLSASIGFNLLLGRAWPPGPADYVAVGEVCRDLGLAALIDRMPGGLQQQVGEIGWQLSHGERGRMYIARALLQAPDVLILDETLDALDPATRASVLRSILARVPIVIAIEHV